MEYNNLSTCQVEKNVLRSKQKLYEHGDKAGKILAHQLKQTTANLQISEINITQGVTTCVPQLINDQFREYNARLYASDVEVNRHTIQSFLDALDIPTLTLNSKNSLDKPLTISEIQTAIQSMHSGKAPGPDGFPIEFYKVFSSKLTAFLKLMYVETLEKGGLPPTLTQATISVLLKKDKNSLDCSSY
ncbi:hypothetical protein LDENG_00134980 [Lucifuga dentata]|nr:hypothetical protein LDENG_00134980 [Lucifuga dentata]